MKIVLLAPFVLLLFAQQQCQEADYARQLQKKWVHSYEEDSVGIQAYRPAGYDFPPSRGRRGMEFRSDGTFIRYEIGPSDGELAIPGSWDPIQGKKTVHISLQNDKPQTYNLEILILNDNLLKVKKTEP